MCSRDESVARRRVWGVRACTRAGRSGVDDESGFRGTRIFEVTRPVEEEATVRMESNPAE